MKQDSFQAAPWPMDELRRRLLEGDTLHLLTRRKQTSKPRDVRECRIEALAQEVMNETFGEDSVVTRGAIKNTLDLRNAPFPGRAIPDIAVHHAGQTHVLELKSSRVNDNRFDKVFDSVPFKKFLSDIRDTGREPWEVEQDLIKLSLYPRLSDRVGNCMFLMVDAYEGAGRSWTSAFGSPAEFKKTMQTNLVQSWADTLLHTTRIESLETGTAKARLITCVVPPWMP